MTVPDSLDLQQVQAALHATAPGRMLRQIARPDSGLTGAVWLLLTDDRDYVLRTFPPETAGWKPEKEWIVYDQMRLLNIPVPEIVTVDLSRELLPCAYAISERLPGETLSRCYSSLSIEERGQVYRQLGDYLGRMHSLNFPAFGDLQERDGVFTVGPAHELSGAADRGPFATWRALHGQIAERHLSFLQNSEFSDLVEPLREYFSRHSALLDDAITPCLLHMDLHCGNILVSGDRITGILDVEESLVGHNEFDLMRTELAHFRDGDPDIAEVFFAAYGEHVRLPDGYVPRKTFYELSRSLVGLCCAVTYGDRYAHGAEAEKQATRTHIHQLLRRDTSL